MLHYHKRLVVLLAKNEAKEEGMPRGQFTILQFLNLIENKILYLTYSLPLLTRGSKSISLCSNRCIRECNAASTTWKFYIN